MVELRKGRCRKAKNRTNDRNSTVEPRRLRDTPLTTTHPNYADSGTYDSKYGDVLSAVCARQAALGLCTECQAHRWCFVPSPRDQANDSTKHKRYINAAGGTDERISPASCQAAALRLPPHGLLFICAGNGGGRIHFQRRRRTCSTAAASRGKRGSFRQHASHTDTDDKLDKLNAPQMHRHHPKIQEVLSKEQIVR